MARAAGDTGAPLIVRSANRSARQEAAFTGWAATSGQRAALRYSARPGHSEHQLGTTLDLGAEDGSGALGATHLEDQARPMDRSARVDVRVRGELSARRACAHQLLGRGMARSVRGP